jgi:hypothetical protein
MASAKLCGVEMTSYVRLGGGGAESAPTYVYLNATSIHRRLTLFRYKQISPENTQQSFDKRNTNPPACLMATLLI